ncbi:hypothetical protein [Natranaerobius thermophilus]|uniref:Uncharacterized protein n=1 Tax=Natranaerobius thermophilus (strain ATCC BAA-1301 / DSM 18059 / JW/NM-WN-LF) TaxID=457570 RepID=B2A8D7_NATTJ|nr:hypothetical protein [Natranaerobius thermophilus]ACB84503.1 hypothetical protein Nther_0918 [Natranaerobius thermophilus JW/NM-WN-LF]
MFKKILGIFMVVSLIAGAAIVIPGQVVSAGEGLDELELSNQNESNSSVERCPIIDENEYTEWENWRIDKDQKQIERIEELVEEGVISEEEGQELIQAIEEKEYEGGNCPVDGQRERSFNMNLKNYFDSEEDREAGYRNGRGSGYSDGRGPGSCRNR